jgi:pimeloyl-ACP methyl ester carboxylesterase
MMLQSRGLVGAPPYRQFIPLTAHMTTTIPDLSKASRVSPARAGDTAYRLFCRPRLSPHASPDHAALLLKSRIHLSKAAWRSVETPVGTVQLYDFGPKTPHGHTILLVHGWTSEASFMSAFVEPLRQRGHRVLTFDFPAHGHSPGRETNVMDCARAMAQVAATLPPIDMVVAHSMGCLVSLLVAEGRAPLAHPSVFGRFVFIAPPDRLSTMTGDFADHLGLNQPARRSFERHVERACHRPLAELSSARVLSRLRAPTLIVHCRDDAQVAFEDAETIWRNASNARLHGMKGLGHRRVLYAPPVVRLVRDFADLVASP